VIDTLKNIKLFAATDTLKKNLVIVYYVCCIIWLGEQ